MSNFRLWLFRSLVAVAAVLMVTSVIMPWWRLEIIPWETWWGHWFAKVYQYGVPESSVAELIYDNVEPSFMEDDITPLYQTVLALVYIAASVGLMLYSTWLKGRKGQLLLGGIGLIYIAYAAIAAFVVIAGRLAEYGVPLQGETYISGESRGDSGYADIYTSLQFGYYLAYAAGGLCLALALLRNKIVGRPKASA